MELAAGAFGVKLQYLDVKDPKDIETAFEPPARGVLSAVLMLSEACRSLLSEHRLWNSRQRAGSRRYTTGENLWKPVGL